MNCQELPKSRPWRNSGPNYAIPSSAPSSSAGILIKDPPRGENKHQLKRKLIDIHRGEGSGAGRGGPLWSPAVPFHLVPFPMRPHLTAECQKIDLAFSPSFAQILVLYSSW